MNDQADSKRQNLLGKIITVIIYLLVLIFAVVALMSKFSIGGIKLFSIQSGSMEPTIRTGSVVFVKTEATYNANDIITFKNDEDPNKTITHRIIDKNTFGVPSYKTQGDANSSADASITIEDQVIGKVFYSIQYLGYLTAFVRTTPGLILLIIIPVTIIIYEEIRKIHTEAKKVVKRRNELKHNKTKVKNGEDNQEIQQAKVATGSVEEIDTSNKD